MVNCSRGMNSIKVSRCIQVYKVTYLVRKHGKCEGYCLRKSIKCFLSGDCKSHSIIFAIFIYFRFASINICQSYCYCSYFYEVLDVSRYYCMWYNSRMGLMMIWRNLGNSFSVFMFGESLTCSHQVCPSSTLLLIQPFYSCLASISHSLSLSLSWLLPLSLLVSLSVSTSVLH